MLEWLKDNWGNLASVAGLVATVFGLGVAIWQVMKTRRAAEAAREAADQAGRTIWRELSQADLRDAIARIQQVKEYQGVGRWDLAQPWYQPIRATLADIISRYHGLSTTQKESLRDARSQMRLIEDEVRPSPLGQTVFADAERFGRTLNRIQEELEALAGELRLQGQSEQGG